MSDFLPNKPVWTIPTIQQLSQLIDYEDNGLARFHPKHGTLDSDRIFWSNSITGSRIWVLLKMLHKPPRISQLIFYSNVTRNTILYVCVTENYLWWSDYFPDDTYEKAEEILKTAQISWSFRTPKMNY